MISESTISRVMAELGKRGTGKAKKRGDRKYYQEIRARRKTYASRVKSEVEEIPGKFCVRA